MKKVVIIGCILLFICLLCTIFGIVGIYLYNKNNDDPIDEWIENIDSNSSPEEETQVQSSGIFEDYSETNDSDLSVNGYKKLTETNSRAYYESGFVQGIIEVTNEYVELYSDATETTLKVPAGWYGYYSPGKTDIFVNYDESLLVTTQYMDLGQEFTTVRDLQEYMAGGVLSDTTLTLENTEALDDDRLLVTYKHENGKTLFMLFNMSSVDGQFIRYTSIAAYDDLEGAEELLLAIEETQMSLYMN